MTNLVDVENVTDDPNMLRFIRSLECRFKHKINIDKMKWWLEEQSRYMIYGRHFLSLNNHEETVKDLQSLDLEFS